MADLRTDYLGLTLRNPVIVASSGLTKNEEKVKACEDAGAGAVVLKSLFEEVITAKNFGNEYSMEDHPEVLEYIQSNAGFIYGSADYFRLISNSKKNTSIPVIASINCVSNGGWTSVAREIESSGADALELNIFSVSTDSNANALSVEKQYYDLVADIRAKVKIPIAVKIGKHFTSLPNFVVNLENAGANGIVLFNRFTEPEIDIETFSLKSHFSFSTSEEVYLPLRWISILYRQVKGYLCATTGVKSHEDVIKLLLVGSSSVQIASLLYRQGLGEIETILGGLNNWLDSKQFPDIKSIRGKLSFIKSSKPLAAHYLRAQFIEKISEVE
ncbi:MAG: dihydroorotate dehydrogenase-like protein [Ignavibacteriaceae bacterium]|nr:dihydroorotate dehydrogenase-like protein [Ignavibacteriaceae bacterium]NUM70684.1 dihydroorotate dehydrogenase-like protein [Ignavibacteriaceae bacterium]